MKIRKKPIIVLALGLVLCLSLVIGMTFHSPFLVFAVTQPEDNQYVFEPGDAFQIVGWYGDEDWETDLKDFENPDAAGTYDWWNETKLTYNGTRWKSDNYMRWQNIDKDGNGNPYHHFLAYYPASIASPNDDLSKIEIELTGDMEKDDILRAEWSGKKTNNTVNLMFDHLLSRFDVHLTFGNQYENVTDIVVKAELVQTGTLNLMDGTVAPGLATGEQTLTSLDEVNRYDWSASTITIPNTYDGDLKLTISFKANGEQKELTYTHTNPIQFESGERTTLILAVGNDVVEIADVTVSDWADGGTINAGEAEEE